MMSSLNMNELSGRLHGGINLTVSEIIRGYEELLSSAWFEGRAAARQNVPSLCQSGV